MYNNYYQQPQIPVQQPRMTPQVPQFGSLRGHPVSSLEEVKATSIAVTNKVFKKIKGRY